MNCPSCLGRLWIEDMDGDFFRCEECNGTGDQKREMATVTDIRTARDLRDRRRVAKMVPDGSGNDAA